MSERDSYSCFCVNKAQNLDRAPLEKKQEQAPLQIFQLLGSVFLNSIMYHI